MSVTTDLSKETVEGLRARLRGPLLTPGDPAYESARAVWNGMIDKRPALLARCLGVADVVAGVQFARETGIPLAIKGGGHNIAGLAVADGALVLDMSLMRGVWVDTTSRVAHAQPGCLLGDVDRETQVHGLAAVLGFVSETGVTGLTLGGGFGYLSRRFGWTSDNVVSMDVVTAEGKTVHASEIENADLFWGLRGGGGNFGVVTGIEYKLYAVGPEITGGAIAWPMKDAPGVLDMLNGVMSEAPPELTCAAVLRMAPPAPWLPPAWHGKPVIAVVACLSEPSKKGLELVARIKAFGSPVGDVLQKRPYTIQQSLLDATQPRGRRYYWKSEYLAEITPAVLAKTVSNAESLLSPHSAVILFQIDGALNKLPNDHSAVGNRDAKFVLNITASWERKEDDDKNIEWARAAWRDMREFSTGGTYLNFLTEEEGDDRTRSALGENYAKLVEIKAKWDPKNVFRVNKNIAPSET